VSKVGKKPPSIVMVVAEEIFVPALPIEKHGDAVLTR
jgi:hypothetical protein